MTVNTISSIAEFVTNGVTTNYPFYFKFLANEDLVVTYVAPDGGSSILILGTHYVVNGAGSDQGGSIVTTTALPGPGQLVVSREMDAFQQTSLRNQGKFLAETHEDVFDKLTMLIQQGFAIFKRALTRPFGREYFFAENRRIANLKDPVDAQDAATKKSVEAYVSSILETGQGPINNAANVVYVYPDGIARSVQSLATKNNSLLGSAGIAHNVGTVRDALLSLDSQLEGLNSEVENLQQSAFGSAKESSFSLFGGQLAEFKRDLSDPLQQFVSATFVGDSITWGMTVTGGGTVLPRTGTLTDQRNNGTSPSWMNLLHQYLGDTYCRDSTVSESLWSGASGGVNIFQYSRPVFLYPGLAPIARAGAWSSTPTAASKLGQQFDVNTTTSPGNNSFQFVMTGTGISLVFAAINGGGSYRVLVNGILQGTFITDAIAMGVPVSYGNVRLHDFGTYLADALVRIEAVNATGLIRFEAIQLDKTLQIINQGIVGTTFTRYTNILIPGGAILGRSKYVFCMLGTNDRGDTPANTGQPSTSAALDIRISNFLAAVAGVVGPKRVILICANEVSDGNQALPVYYFNMTDVRSSLYRAALINKLDFIDQYAVTRKLKQDGISYLADGLHPNDVGCRAMYDNIRVALEHADSGSRTDFAIVYPNSGSEASPATVEINSRYVSPNPFKGFDVIVEAEVKVGSKWGVTGWYAATGGVGVRASMLDDAIIVQTGSLYLTGTSGMTGGSFSGATLSSVPLPCRVKVWKVKA